MVDRLRDAIQILKKYNKNEEQRQHFRTALTLVAPKEQALPGDKSGMATAICNRLGIDRTSAIFRDCIQTRKEIDSKHKVQVEKEKARRAEMSEEEFKQTRGFKVGDSVLCDHGEGELISMTTDGSCKVCLHTLQSLQCR